MIDVERKYMPRKTLALIIALVVVTVVLFVIALKGSNQQGGQNAQPTQMVSEPSPTVPLNSILSLSPNPVTVKPGQKGSVDVTLNTTNDVTAVQLELKYDPTVLSNVQVTKGQMFPNPVVLINRGDTAKGNFTYALGIAPQQQPVKGNGVVATVTFTAKGTAGSQTQLELLPTTLVTARGVKPSVLKSASGTTVSIEGAGSTTTSSGSGVTR